MNKINLMGHVGQDPEIRVFENNSKHARFSMATTEEYTNRAGEKVKDVQWHNIIAWNGLVEVVEAKIKKGSHISVQGKLAHRSYTDKSGQKRNITEIVANEINVTPKP